MTIISEVKAVDLSLKTILGFLQGQGLEQHFKNTAERGRPSVRFLTQVLHQIDLEDWTCHQLVFNKPINVSDCLNFEKATAYLAKAVACIETKRRT